MVMFQKTVETVNPMEISDTSKLSINDDEALKISEPLYYSYILNYLLLSTRSDLLLVQPHSQSLVNIPP